MAHALPFMQQRQLLLLNFSPACHQHFVLQLHHLLQYSREILKKPPPFRLTAGRAGALGRERPQSKKRANLRAHHRREVSELKQTVSNGLPNQASKAAVRGSTPRSAKWPEFNGPSLQPETRPRTRRCAPAAATRALLTWSMALPPAPAPLPPRPPLGPRSSYPSHL